MTKNSFTRRRFLTGAALGATSLLCARHAAAVGSSAGSLEAGEGVVDTTPPLGIEMAGFHRPAGQERLIAGIRRPTAARALVLRLGDTQVAIVSLDAIAVSPEMTARVQAQIAARLGVPAERVRLCATHTHSMPTFRRLRQWGALPVEYLATVEEKIVQAVERAQADLAPATLHVGTSRAVGASNNRTTANWKTDEHFGPESTDADRWLDTAVHVLHFERSGGKQNLLWYHFSAHPVCYQDDQAGPDWPGRVAELVGERHQLAASFLQGHCGDVNAGDAAHWIGTEENTAVPVAAAITRALDAAQTVRVDTLRMQAQPVALPLDITLFRQWLEAYRADPSACSTGVWVDAGFAEAWYRDSVSRDLSQTTFATPLSVMQLGEVALVFHSAELYSFYGLAIRRDSPLSHTLVVGYADDIVGYLPDPTAYTAQEYAAITVPKILDLPPFEPTAASVLTATAIQRLRQLVG
jgi:hypothetical protein